MAFCYISIPSLEHPLHKLQLYTLSAQTAYLNQSLSQGLKHSSMLLLCHLTMCLGDAFLKMAITLLSDFPKQIESEGKLVASDRYLGEAISNIMSTLVAVPVRLSHLCHIDEHLPFVF